MPRHTVLAAFAAACLLIPAGAARAADPVASEACMAPLTAGSADPAVRDVHFHVGAGSSVMTISACVVSAHANTLQGVAANVGIFSKDGVLINYAGGAYSNVAPLTNPSASGPKLVLLYGVSIQLDPRYGLDFAPNTVVALTTVACQKTPPACEPAPAQTTTFLVPVQVDEDLGTQRAK
jgi:hypothetical protein